MAVSRYKETNYKLENLPLSGDHIENEIKTSKRNMRTSMESKLASQEDDPDINTEISSDDESAYEDSFSSDSSDEVSESEDTSHRSSFSEIPKLQLSNFTSAKQQGSSNLNKKFASTSKICDDSFLTLEDKFKCISLNEVRSIKSGPIRCTRKNMSFTNDEIMKIERDNEILLRKIMAQQKSQKTKQQPVQRKLSSSAINRRKLQKKIEEDNMLLLRRLQQAKPCVVPTYKLSGCRTTHL